MVDDLIAPLHDYFQPLQIGSSSEFYHMRLGVIVEGDQFVYKTDHWKIDWMKATYWPFTPDEVEVGHAFFINTRSMKRKAEGLVFERPAISAGFEVIHRRSKIGESSIKTKFSRGSTAILGAVAEALAWHVDHLIIHAWQPAAAECISRVLEYHSALKVTFVATSPSPHLRKLAEWLPDRVNIINPNDSRSNLEYLDEDGDESQGQNGNGGESSAENGSSAVTTLKPEQGIHRARRIGRVSDFGNIHGWAKSIGCHWDGIFDLRRLLTWKPLGMNGVAGQVKAELDWSHWVVPMRDSASSSREAGLSSAEDAGWNVLTAPVIDEHALDDGVIGVAMARSSHLCDTVMLLSGDIDFDSVMHFLTRVHTTNFFRLAPPPMEDPYNCTSVRVTNSAAATFIPLDEVLVDLFHVSNDHRPNHLRSDNRKHINQRNKNALRDFDDKLAEFRERELQKIMRNIADRNLDQE